MSEPMVKLVDVYKAYKIGKRYLVVLKGVNLEVEGGESVAILGKSGSGKTTLLNIIAGLDRPSYGHVYVDGVDLVYLSENELAKFRRSTISFIFQSYNLISELTALENVLLAQKARFGKTDRVKAMQILKLVGLEEHANHRPHELSGGQQQRVAIAMALAKSPKLIIADEPTGALDSKTRERVLDLLLEAKQKLGTTLLVVTHDEDVARRMERIIRIKDGEIVEVGTRRPHPAVPDQLVLLSARG